MSRGRLAYRRGTMHLVVLEPHADDAALSAGAHIAQRSGRDRVTIVTVAPRSTFTRDWYAGVQRLDAATVTALRSAESRRAAHLLGADHQAMDEEEATLRFAPGPDWLAYFPRVSRAFSAFFGSLPFAADVDRWAASIGARLDALRPDALWIPLGVGEHVDHRLVRDAALRAARGRDLELALYEDLPYAHHHPDHAARVVAALERAGARIERTVEPRGLETKLRAVAAYASQAEPGALGALVEARARAAGGEVLFELQARGAEPDLVASALAADRLRAIESEVRTLLAQASTVQHLQIRARAPFARWSDERTVLATTFPRATIEVWVQPEEAWQVGPDAVVRATDDPAWAAPPPPGAILMEVGPGPPRPDRLVTPALVHVAALLTHVGRPFI